MRNVAWIADYPDGDNFMQLLYGPNTQQSKQCVLPVGRVRQALRKSKTVPDGPERNKLYRAMARRMEADTAWIMNDSRVRNMLMQPRVIGYKRHPALQSGMDVSRPRFGRPQVIGTRLLAFFVLCGAFRLRGRAAPHPQIPIWNARGNRRSVRPGAVERAGPGRRLEKLPLSQAAGACSARGIACRSWSRTRRGRRGAHQHVPDAATRTAGEACLLKMTEFSTELLQNEAIYARFQRTAPPTVSTASSSRTWWKRSRHGSGLAPEKRARMKAILQRLEEVRQAFAAQCPGQQDAARFLRRGNEGPAGLVLGARGATTRGIFWLDSSTPSTSLS